MLCPSLPSTLPQLCKPQRQLQDPPTPGCAETGPNRAPLHPAQACPSPKAGVLDDIAGLPASSAPLQCWGSPGFSQPRSSPRQGFSPADSRGAGGTAPALPAQREVQGRRSGAGSRARHAPLGAAWHRPSLLLHEPQCTRAWTGFLQPLAVHPSSATHRPAELCSLQMPVRHQHRSFGGPPESRCQRPHSCQRATPKPTSGLEEDRQAPRLRTLPSERADPCPCSCQGAEPPVPHSTAGSVGRGGSRTAALWPPWEVQVAPKPSQVSQGWGAVSLLQQSPRNGQRGLRCLSSEAHSPHAAPFGGCHIPPGAAR